MCFGNAATSRYLELATLGSSSVGGDLQPAWVIDDDVCMLLLELRIESDHRMPCMLYQASILRASNERSSLEQ